MKNIKHVMCQWRCRKCLGKVRGKKFVCRSSPPETSQSAASPQSNVDINANQTLFYKSNLYLNIVYDILYPNSKIYTKTFNETDRVIHCLFSISNSCGIISKFTLIKTINGWTQYRIFTKYYKKSSYFYQNQNNIYT